MIVSSKSIFVPIFNKTTKLASVYVKNFHLYSSIENCLPIGYFDFLDKDGAFIETLEGITIGSIVQFEMMSDDNDINGMKLPEYTVLFFNLTTINIPKVTGRVKFRYRIRS